MKICMNIRLLRYLYLCFEYLVHNVTTLLPTYRLRSKKHTSTAICTVLMSNCIEAKGAASTMSAWVGGAIITWFTNQSAILVITAKVMQVCVGLYKFSNVVFKKGGNGEGWYCRSNYKY